MITQQAVRNISR